MTQLAFLKPLSLTPLMGACIVAVNDAAAFSEANIIDTFDAIQKS
jgi:hypothetical protein